MNRWRAVAIVTFALGAAFSLPLAASAVVLVVSVRDPATVSLPTSVSASDREAGLAEIGDIISVKEDDWTLNDQRFGRLECKNNPPANGGRHICVELPGLSHKEALPLIANVFCTRKDGETDIKKFRRYRIAWERLPDSVRNEAYYTGMTSLTNWRQGIILDKEAN